MPAMIEQDVGILALSAPPQTGNGPAQAGGRGADFLASLAGAAAPTAPPAETVTGKPAPDTLPVPPQPARADPSALRVSLPDGTEVPGAQLADGQADAEAGATDAKGHHVAVDAEAVPDLKRAAEANARQAATAAETKPARPSPETGRTGETGQTARAVQTLDTAAIQEIAPKTEAGIAGALQARAAAPNTGARNTSVAHSPPAAAPDMSGEHTKHGDLPRSAGGTEIDLTAPRSEPKAPGTIVQAGSGDSLVFTPGQGERPVGGDGFTHMAQSTPMVSAAAPAPTLVATAPMTPAHGIIAASPAEIATIVQQSLGGEDRPERVVVQLDPPELGRVSIDFKFDAQGLQHVTITGDTPEALRQLRAMHFELIQALERHGLSGQDMSFRQNTSHDQTSFAGTFAGRDDDPAEPALIVPSAALTDRPTLARALAGGGLDIRL